MAVGSSPTCASAPAEALPEACRGHEISQENPGDMKYRDRRLLALYFDMSAMPVPISCGRWMPAQKFIRTQMTPADLMAIMSYDGAAVQVLAGLYRRPRRAADDHCDPHCRRRPRTPARRLRCTARPTRGRLRPGRFRIQHFQHRPPAIGAADSGEDAGYAEREEVPDLLRQRTEAERRRQSGAAAATTQCGDSRQRIVLADRCARSGGAGADGRRDQGIARRTPECIPARRRWR